MSFVEYPPRNHQCDANEDDCVVLEEEKQEKGIITFFRHVRCVFCGELWLDERRRRG